MEEKQVPEDQLAFIRQKLLGNEAFARLRGRMAQPFSLGMLGHCIDAANSPTDFCRQWDEFSSDARIIGNILACCKREGYTWAFNQIDEALRVPTHCFPGETIPFHLTESCTVLIVDFPQMLKAIRWIRCVGSVYSLDRYVRGYFDNKPESITAWPNKLDYLLTKDLFEALPILFGHVRKRISVYPYVGQELVDAYEGKVFKDFDRAKLMENGRRLLLAHDAFNRELEVWEGCFGYLIHEDQGKVLARFSREEQKRIATWTVRLPKASIEKDNSFLVCFHPENGHERWKGATNIYASPGYHDGYGVALLDAFSNDPITAHANFYHEGDCKNRITLSDFADQIAFELQTATL